MTNNVYHTQSGYDELSLAYYPGMIELTFIDNWHDLEKTFNVSVATWRAMNAAIEKAHNGE